MSGDGTRAWLVNQLNRPVLGVTVLTVVEFGTLDYLRDTLEQLPTIGIRSVTVAPGNFDHEARVIIEGDAGFIRFALEKQGYARVVRIQEDHGPSSREIPVTGV